MYVVSVVGPSDAGRSGLVERLARRLDERGRVGTVTRLSTAPEIDGDGDRASHRAAPGTTYGLTDGGEWVAAGEENSLTGALDGLARDHDYAVVEGFADARLPTVAFGGRDHEGDALVEAPDVEGVDVDYVVDALVDAEPYETLGSLVARAKRSPEAEKAGAIATFTGRVRARDDDQDAPTEHLTFEKYEGVAAERTATIREELEARHGVYEVLVHHRTGVIEYGEDIVFVVVLAGHREEAFAAVSDGIDRFKDEVPIFKKEVTVDEQFWVHERS